jgi:hypothetical protein
VQINEFAPLPRVVSNSITKIYNFHRRLVSRKVKSLGWGGGVGRHNES